MLISIADGLARGAGTTIDCGVETAGPQVLGLAVLSAVGNGRDR